MARIQTALAAIRRSPQDHLPSRETVDQICRDVGHVYRDRVLSPYVFIQLFCLQVLGGNTAVNHLRHLSGVNFSSSSYCEARKNLPMEFFEALLKREKKRGQVHLFRFYDWFFSLQNKWTCPLFFVFSLSPPGIRPEPPSLNTLKCSTTASDYTVP